MRRRQHVLQPEEASLHGCSQQVRARRRSEATCGRNCSDRVFVMIIKGIARGRVPAAFACRADDYLTAPGGRGPDPLLLGVHAVRSVDDLHEDAPRQILARVFGISASIVVLAGLVTAPPEWTP